MTVNTVSGTNNWSKLFYAAFEFDFFAKGFEPNEGTFEAPKIF